MATATDKLRQGGSRSRRGRLCVAVILVASGFSFSMAASVYATPSPRLAADCLNAGNEKGLQACRRYARENRNRAYSLLDVGRRLGESALFERAIVLYNTGLNANPGHRELLQARILANSELNEAAFISARRAQLSTNTDDLGESLEADRIKCESLSGTTALSACRRLLRKGALRLPSPPSDSTAASPGAAAPTGTIDLGRFRALVIGNNRYEDFERLETAVNDARVVADVLETKYGFDVTVLKNASRYKLLKALSELRKDLGPDDNLLIYYAGHGYLDEQTRRGYWLPVDAEQDNYANWLSTADVTDMLRGMAAQRVLVVADSCYSGVLTRSARRLPPDTKSEDLVLLERAAAKRTRTVLTSGGLEPVLDSGNAGHSVFANAFIDILRSNTSLLSGTQLFSDLRRRVVLAADQTPEYSDIRNAGHEGGDFFFLR